jgi:hypothetical protein
MRAIAFLFVGMAAGALAAVACGSSSSATPDAGSDGGKRDVGARVDGASHDTAAPLPPLEAKPPGLIPAGSRVDSTSTPVTFDAVRQIVWTANTDVGTVSYVGVNQGSQRVLEEIPVGSDIRSVALSPDGAWVAAVDRGAAGVALIDADSRVVKRIIPVGTHPRSAVWDASDPRWLYVTLEDEGAVAIIDRTLGVLKQTVPIGRIPGGLAVSARRPVLYVTHRIDAMVTTVSLPGLTVLGNVTLADQPAPVGEDAGTAAKVPQGMPFAFDSVAWTADGNTMWLAHELLAPTHPFQFTETLFPAISVVDFSGSGAEVQTDPNDPGGVIAGRKLLFGAINLLDSTGNNVIVSQPCAVAMHPNGLTAYALACASDDLITFDMTQGIAIDILRNLPGSHPIGIALDGHADALDGSLLPARAFVLSDQSHTLLTLDLGGGSLLGEASIIDGPLSLIAKDPVAPDVRAGLTLFFSANSSSGGLTTTGNNWISCAGCHLDGFQSPTLRLFESSNVVNEAVNAQIGHAGLKDLFSTAPTPDAPQFDPHDILVALEEQGGLSPDRTGASRVGAIDASAPTDAAATMARQIAHVIARDLPIGPTWLLPTTDAGPVPADDTTYCGGCHEAEYAAWKTSVHAHSAEDTMMRFCVTTEQGIVGEQFSRLCAGCHDPVNARLRDTTFAPGKVSGVTCLGCHDVSRTIRAGGNADLAVTTEDWTVDHRARANASLAVLRTPEFCAGCHEQFVPGNGLLGITTYNEWSYGPFANTPAPSLCVDCHFTPTAPGITDHSVPGGNVYLATQYNDAGAESALIAAQQQNLAAVMRLSATKNADGSVTVNLHNRGSGHGFPTGVTDIVEPWVELQAVDASGNVLAHYGGPDTTTGLLSPTAARLGIDLADQSGSILYRHELSEAFSVPFDRRIPPGGSLDLVLPSPGALPSGATGLNAVLYYRNIRTTYLQAATGSSTATAPATEMAHVAVP